MQPADVYWAISETPGWTRLLAARDALDDAERARAAGFVFAADRDAFVAAHALLRLALSAHAGGEAADWRFAAAPSGKPELSGPNRGAGLTFSLSHARTIVACAVSHGRTVGVDVEAIAAEDVDDALLGFACSSAEQALLERFEPAGRPAAFARLWTLKEAVFKAVGDARVDGPDPAAWELVSLMPSERHALALVRAAGSPGDAVVREVINDDP